MGRTSLETLGCESQIAELDSVLSERHGRLGRQGQRLAQLGVAGLAGSSSARWCPTGTPGGRPAVGGRRLGQGQALDGLPRAAPDPQSKSPDLWIARSRRKPRNALAAQPNTPSTGTSATNGGTRRLHSSTDPKNNALVAIPNTSRFTDGCNRRWSRWTSNRPARTWSTT